MEHLNPKICLFPSNMRRSCNISLQPIQNKQLLKLRGFMNSISISIGIYHSFSLCLISFLDWTKSPRKSPGIPRNGRTPKERARWRGRRCDGSELRGREDQWPFSGLQWWEVICPDFHGFMMIDK